MTPKAWYRFENAAPSQRVADINIIDFIGGWGEDFFEDSLTAKGFIDDLGKLPDSIRTIRLHVNSPGGDVFAAVNIANALRDQRVSKNRTIDVIVEGLAASAASVVIMAGNTIRIADNALVMVHNPWTVASGDAKSMRKVAERLDKVRQTLVATYRWQSPLDESQIGALMDKTTWMDADEAIANGFATEKIKGLKAAASYNREALAKLYIPDHYLDRLYAMSTGLAASGKGSATDALTPSAGLSARTRGVLVTARTDTHMPKPITDRIKELEATLLAKTGDMNALDEKVSAEGRTKDAAEKETFTELLSEIKALQEEIADQREMAAINAAAAKPVAGDTPQTAANTRGNHSVIALKREHPKGTLFTRYAMAVAAGKGSLSDTIAYAKRWEEDTPEVLQYIRAAALPGTTSSTSPGWGSELVYQTNLPGEFVELLRPATIVGRINGIRMVPFNVRIPVQTGGSTVNWVGEAAPKPVSELVFDAITLGHNKIAGIVVLTDELVRLSSPSAEATVRRDLVEQIARFMDAQFITPSVAAGANNPASVTNGVSAITASGTDADALYADLNLALATFDNADMGTNSLVFIMTPALARGISTLRNALGQFEFSGVTMAGGTLLGFPVLVSSGVPSGTIVIIKADEILMADDGQVTLDASNQATLDMNGGSSPNFNLWQKNCIGIRAERWITWRKRRTEAVALISSASYGPSVGSP